MALCVQTAEQTLTSIDLLTLSQDTYQRILLSVVSVPERGLVLLDFAKLVLGVQMKQLIID